MPILKQLVSFRGLDDSAHASIAQQIGELAAHHLKRHLHPLSTELVSLRARVERDTLRTGDADRVKLRLELSTATRAAGEVAEHETAALKTAFDELERQLERHTSHLLKMDSWRRNARRDSRVRLKTVVVAGTPEDSARLREQMSELLAPVQRIARREPAYMQVRGDRSSDYPTLVDVIDKTLARAFQRVRDHPGISIEEGSLHRLVLLVSHDEAVRGRPDEGRWVSLESCGAVTLVRPPDEVDDAISRFSNSGNRTKRSSWKTCCPAATKNLKRQRASMKCARSRASC